jgi:hypothetical protein
MNITPKITPPRITKLEPNQIFVFGSNERGIHGKGAALQAKQKFGARQGVGVGRSGNTYAIPTKDEHIKTLPLRVIADYIAEFLRYAVTYPELEFLVTQVGCGLANWTPAQIAPLFFRHEIPNNVSLPNEFWLAGNNYEQ